MSFKTRISPYSCTIALSLSQLSTSIDLRSAGTKEYEADWLKSGVKVLRDASGKFASKAGDATQAVGSAFAAVPLGLVISEKIVLDLATDPKVRKRLGLMAGQSTAKAISKAVEKIDKDSAFAKRMGEYATSLQTMLEKEYGEQKSPLLQSLHEAALITGGDRSKKTKLKDKIEFAVCQYAAFHEALKDPRNLKEEDINPKFRKEVMNFGTRTYVEGVAVSILFGNPLFLITGLPALHIMFPEIKSKVKKARLDRYAKGAGEAEGLSKQTQAIAEDQRKAIEKLLDERKKEASATRD
jgi:hypothetical protein